MRSIDPELQGRLGSGATTLCRCWRVRRRDGVELGFTDHDMDLSFGGLTYRAGSGMDASAVQAGTGLSVDNAQAVGALTALDCVASLAPFGRLVIFGQSSGPPPPIDVGPLFGQNQSVLGYSGGAYRRLRPALTRRAGFGPGGTAMTAAGGGSADAPNSSSALCSHDSCVSSLAMTY